MSDKLTVYWTAGNFKLDDESWTYLYQYPEKVKDNKFVIKSAIDDEFKLPMDEINRIQKGKVHRGFVESDAMLAILQPGRSELPEHALIKYNMNWHFYADSDVKIKTTLPQKEAPVKNAVFESEERELNGFYHQYGLSYNIPLSSETFNLKSGSPLMYLEFDTDKEVELVRYDQSTQLHNLAEETYVIGPRYGRAVTEEDRLANYRKAGMPEIILSYIKKNVI